MATSKKPTKKPNVGEIRRQSGTANTFYVTWTWDAPKSGKSKTDKTDKFEIEWSYKTADGKWFPGSSSSVDNKSQKVSTYSPGDNAIQIKVSVKPISKKDKDVKKDKKTEKTYWWHAGKAYGWSWNPNRTKTLDYLVLDSKYYISEPSAPEVTIETHGSAAQLVATLNYTNDVATDYGNAQRVEFRVIADDISVYGGPYYANLAYNTATIKISAAPGHKYKAQARIAVSKNSGADGYPRVSDWSEFSSNVETFPSRINVAPSVSATSDSEVLVTWPALAVATGYEIEYTKKQQYFDSSSSEVQTVTIDRETTSWYISGLDNVHTDDWKGTWYFRIRGTNTSDVKGAWSPIASIVLGTKPEPPMTWSYVVTGKIGEDAILNWAHSSADGSDQAEARINLKYEDGSEHTVTVTGTEQSYTLVTTGFPDRRVVKWKVQTKGAGSSYSDWSTEREITFYIPPTLSVGVYGSVNWWWDPFNFVTDSIYTAQGDPSDPIDTVTSYPVTIRLQAFPDTQTAIAFTVSIVSNTEYDTEDAVGRPRHVTEGQEIYTTYVLAKNNEALIRLLPGDIDLEDGASYTINASVAMDSSLSADGEFSFDVMFDETDAFPDAEVTVDNITFTGYIRPYCLDENDEERKDLYFSVYRREYDGRFTPIETNLDSRLNTTAVDPHPSLDYARYRIVALSKETGAISYSDIPGIPVLFNNIVLQWDDEWASFNYDNEEFVEPEDKDWSGSILILPYNIDIQVNSSPDVSMVKYIGRENPVSYYGTQKGESGTWTATIKKSDKETMYAIRRLSRYSGDVYVREPSGIGYWARVTVSYSETHNELTVPVTFNVERVEGGK